MPFDVLPQETQVEVGPYQWAADAILRGCAVSGPCKDELVSGKGNACALGALLLGLGRDRYAVRAAHLAARSFESVWGDVSEKAKALMAAYDIKYGAPIAVHNDSGNFTREQIAARIAALR